MTYRYRVALIFLIGFFIDCVNIFMSAITLPAIAEQLQVSTVTVTWVSNSYILGLTLIIPISNWLASRFGARQIMTLSMLIFTVATFFSGSAEHFSTLIIWRFLQGVGGGLLIPIGQSLTFSFFQGHERSKISTIIMVVALIAPALSPMLGGIIVDMASWRWVFYSNIPFSLFAAILTWIWIKNEAPTERNKPDLKGLLLISGWLTALLLTFSLYGELQSPLIAGATAILVFLLGWLYLRHAKHQPDAIIDLNLFKNAKLRISILLYYAVPGIFTGVNIIAIFYLHTVIGFNASQTGMFMLLYAAGAFVAMIVSGALYNKIGAKRLFIFSLLLHNSGILLLAFVSDKQSLPILIIAYLMMGIGGGVAANCAQTTALYDFKDNVLAKASVIWNINRQIVFSIGSALLMMVLTVMLTIDEKNAFSLSFVIAALLGISALIIVIPWKSETVKSNNKEQYETE